MNADPTPHSMSPVFTPDMTVNAPKVPRTAPAGYIRLTDLASEIGVSSQSIRYWVSSGGNTGFPKARKIGGKMLVFEIAELREYFQRNGVDCTFLDNHQTS